jgi:hypothetical protein
LGRSISQVLRAVLGLPKSIVHFSDFTRIYHVLHSAHIMDVVDIPLWPVRGVQMAISSSTSILDNTMLDSNVADLRCMAHIQSIFSLIFSVTILAWSLVQYDKGIKSKGQITFFLWVVKVLFVFKTILRLLATDDAIIWWELVCGIVIVHLSFVVDSQAGWKMRIRNEEVPVWYELAHPSHRIH